MKIQMIQVIMSLLKKSPEQPQYGTATPEDGGIVYDPTPGSQEKCNEIAGYADSYTDTYKYTIRDTNDNLVSNEATVTITVRCNRDEPNANDDFDETDENTEICIDVLENDTDMEGDTDQLTIQSYTQPKDGRGTVTTSDDCDGLVYTPDDKLCGEYPISGQPSYTAEFSYTNEDADDKLTDTANVYVTVYCVRPPIAVDDGPFKLLKVFQSQLLLQVMIMIKMEHHQSKLNEIVDRSRIWYSNC